MSDYLLKLHVESRGTTHYAEDGTVFPSSAGHVWYEVDGRVPS